MVYFKNMVHKILKHGTVSINQMILQYFLFSTAFITFGIGDAVTGALLMGKKGIEMESNQVMGYIYHMCGPWGFITIKLCLTCILLILFVMICKRSPGNHYWAINGFFVSISLFGIMAIQANLRAIEKLPYWDSSTILFVYLLLIIIFLNAGDMADRHQQRRIILRP
jgi:hypothetical protein